MTAIIKIIYLSLVFGLFQFLLVQQGNTTELPNSVDLKASYCIGLLTQSLSMQQQSKPTQSDLSVMPSLETIHAKNVDKLESALKRINYYLRPRIGQLDLIGLLAAKRLGGNDEIDSDNCSAKCPRVGKAEEIMDCLTKCSPSQFKSCISSSFLPF